MAPHEQLDYQVETIRGLIANTSREQLDNATPCAQWKVRDLLNHMVGGGLMFGTALKGDSVTMDADGPPDLLGDDPVAAWNNAAKTFGEGIDSPGALDRDITLPFGTMPGKVVLEIAKLDLLIHAWDLAQATDQTFDPPEDVVGPALGAAPMIIAPELRNGDIFADEATAPEGSTQIERLAAFAGRAV